MFERYFFGGSTVGMSKKKLGEHHVLPHTFSSSISRRISPRRRHRNNNKMIRPLSEQVTSDSFLNKNCPHTHIYRKKNKKTLKYIKYIILHT